MPLPGWVFVALAVFAAALLGSAHLTRAAALHLAFAVGAMPLIFGAMLHFIPVLTRTRAPRARSAALPLLALAGGILAVASFSLPGMAWGRYAGAALAAAAAGTLLVWSGRRQRGMLGRAHPGLGWYQAALACLVGALLAILASSVWPQHTTDLRRLHLHLNTLGFIGLTAVGTLAVLLPTVVGRPDPEVSAWLRRHLPLALAGTVLVAAGAASLGPLAWLGGVLWLLVLARLAVRWLRRYRAEILAADGAAPLLAAALAGYAVSLLLGAAGASGLASLAPTAAFATGFLPPLVAGAASQLLPVWLRPGMQTAWHVALRAKLGRHGGVRAALFLIAGLAAGLGSAAGFALSAATLLWFILQAAAALLHARRLPAKTPG